MQAPGLESLTHIENNDSGIGKFVCPERRKPWRFAANFNKRQTIPSWRGPLRGQGYRSGGNRRVRGGQPLPGAPPLAAAVAVRVLFGHLRHGLLLGFDPGGGGVIVDAGRLDVVDLDAVLAAHQVAHAFFGRVLVAVAQHRQRTHRRVRRLRRGHRKL